MDASCNLYGETSLWTADSSVTGAGPVVSDRAIDQGGDEPNERAWFGLDGLDNGEFSGQRWRRRV